MGQYILILMLMSGYHGQISSPKPMYFNDFQKCLDAGQGSVKTFQEMSDSNRATFICADRGSPKK